MNKNIPLSEDKKIEQLIKFEIEYALKNKSDKLDLSFIKKRNKIKTNENNIKQSKVKKIKSLKIKK